MSGGEIRQLVIKFNRFFYVLPVASVLLLLCIWNFTNPKNVGPLGVLAVFLILYIFWLSVIFLILRSGLIIFKRIYARSRHQRRLSEKRAYYVASIVAFLPVLLLGLHSVGQLELRDIALAVLFVGLAVFYALKRS